MGERGEALGSLLIDSAVLVEDMVSKEDSVKMVIFVLDIGAIEVGKCLSFVY